MHRDFFLQAFSFKSGTITTNLEYMFGRSEKIGFSLEGASLALIGLRCSGNKRKVKFYDQANLVKEFNLKSLDELDDEMRIALLKRIVKKHKLEQAPISVTLPNTNTILKIMEIPAEQAESNLVEYIKEEISQDTFDDVDEMQIACFGLSNKTQSHLCYLVSAISDDELEGYQGFFERAGLRPVSFELGMLALHNAFESFYHSNNDAPAAVVDIGSSEIRVIIQGKDRNPFFHGTDFGDLEINAKFSELTGQSFVEAECVKLDFLDETKPNRQTMENLSFLEAYCTFASELTTEIRKCIRHYQVAEHILEFGNIYLTGRCAQGRVLKSLISHELKLNVESWNPTMHLVDGFTDRSKERCQYDGFNFSTAIGAVMDDS